ncbi:MAG: hypothetical protein ACK5JD_04100 [Mangrovibacterium sp.]
MKTVLRVTMFFLTVISLASCDWDDDGYSLGDFWVDFGLIESGDDGENFTIHVDDGYAIVPVNMNQIDTEKWANDTRVIVNYTIVGDKDVEAEEKVYYAKINDLDKVLYKPVFEITPETEDSIGNDPIIVDNMWVKDHMLSFRLHYYGNSKIHFINLVKSPGEVTEDDLPLQLELRHNEKGDQRSYLMTAFVTFDLRSIQVEGLNSMAIEIRGTGYDEVDYMYDIDYTY